MSGQSYLKMTDEDRLDEIFYKKLNESSKELRRLAEDMGKFLTPLKNKNPEIDQLIISYQAFQTVDIKQIDTQINNIKDIFLKMDGGNIRKNKLPFDIKGLEDFFEKKNHFTQAANQLVHNAVKIYESCIS